MTGNHIKIPDTLAHDLRNNTNVVNEGGLCAVIFLSKYKNQQFVQNNSYVCISSCYLFRLCNCKLENVSALSCIKLVSELHAISSPFLLTFKKVKKLRIPFYPQLNLFLFFCFLLIAV